MVTAEAKSPASLHKTTPRRLGSSSAQKQGSNNNNNKLERVVIVQPANLQQSPSNTDGENNINKVLIKQWEAEKHKNKMGTPMSDEEKEKFLYEVAKFGSVQGSNSGEEETAAAMQASSNGGAVDQGGEEGDSLSLPNYEQWVAMQKSLNTGTTNSGSKARSSSRINMDAHGYYLPQQQQQLSSSSTSSSSSSVVGEQGEPPKMQQMIPEKQVILRPKSLLDEPSSSSTVNGNKKALSVPALGSTQNNNGQEPDVYYYDAQGLVTYSSASQSTPELTLPDEVYTASGQKLKLSDVHDGGKAEVYLEMNPQAVLGKSWDELNSIQQSLSSSSLSSSSSSTTTTAANAAQQSQDQMIVFLTVATMAIMVGMLSARRLRSRKFLEQCMTPDLDDDLDDIRYDKKFDGNNGSSSRRTAAAGSAAYTYTTSGGSTLGGSNSPGRYSEYEGSETSLPHFSDLYPTQSSSIMGSLSRRSGYGTNEASPGLHWRGDMEKFDV